MSMSFTPRATVDLAEVTPQMVNAAVAVATGRLRLGNTTETRRMLNDKDEQGEYRIPFIVVCDAFQSEMTAYADLVRGAPEPVLGDAFRELLHSMTRSRA